jgi:hypothetical protein
VYSEDEDEHGDRVFHMKISHSEAWREWKSSSLSVCTLFWGNIFEELNFVDSFIFNDST